MRTNDQLAAILGADSFEFDASIGIGSSAVIVTMSYEFDSSGTYNETIESVRTPSRYCIMDYLEESTIDELCILGCKLLIESKQEVF
jgi:hypothetical protein